MARESGRADLSNVDLEQLPAYEPSADVQVEGNRVEEEDDGPLILSPIPTRPGQIPAEVRTGEPPSASANAVPAPDEPPPGYEEAQAQAIGDDLEQRLRREVERRGSLPDP